MFVIIVMNMERIEPSINVLPAREIEVRLAARCILQRALLFVYKCTSIRRQYRRYIRGLRGTPAQIISIAMNSNSPIYLRMLVFLVIYDSG